MLPSEVAAAGLEPTDPRLPLLLDALCAGLASVEGVVGIAVGGSIAAGTADKFSDLDIGVIVAGLAPVHVSEAIEVVRRIVDVGHERWTIPNSILSLITTDWLRLDVLFMDVSDRLPHRALVVWSDGYELPTWAPRPSLRRDPILLEQTVLRVLLSLGLVVRDVSRGDLRLGCFATEALVEELISLMYWQRDLVRGADTGIYAQLPPEDVAVLQSLPVAEPDHDAVVRAQVAVANEYLPRARGLADAWKAEWPQAMETATRAFLLEHLGVTFRET